MVLNHPIVGIYVRAESDNCIKHNKANVLETIANILGITGNNHDFIVMFA